MTDFETKVNALLTKIARELNARGWRMATAESCTGGWIAKCCTDMVGSSNWFDRAYVTYSYRAKEQMLGVSNHDLVKHGAVSEEIARQVVEKLVSGGISDAYIFSRDPTVDISLGVFRGRQGADDVIRVARKFGY